MNPQVYYRKWRPQTLADVAGQKHVTQTLLNALKSGHISHAYLFCGPRGTGKTSTGRILAKAVNCLTNEGKGEPCNTCRLCQATVEDRALDVIEIDGASNRKIDDVRELREKVSFAPTESRYKVYIIDEFHMLTPDACNALLKTLEEPPPHVIFVLATTEVHKVLPTIMSRCQRFDFHRLAQADVVARLSTIAVAEGIKIEPQSLQLIAGSATGSLRDAENLLEQLTTCYGTEIQLTQVQALLGITGDWRAKELIKNIVNNDVSGGIATINSVNKDGLDLRQFNRELVECLRQLMLVKTGADSSIALTAEDIAELKTLSAKASLPQIIKAIKLFSQLELSLDSYSTLPLELAIVECCLPPQAEEKHPAKAGIESAPKPIRTTVSRPQPAAPRPVPAIKPETLAKTAPPTPKPEPAKAPGPPAKPVAEKPAPPPVSKDVPAMTAAPSLASEIERLKLNWKQMIDNVPTEMRKSVAIALLRSAVKPSAVEGDTVILMLQHANLKDNMEKADNMVVAEKILSGFLGRTCRIRCMLEKENNYLVREARKKLGAEVTSVEEK